MEDLERCLANFSPLTPLVFLERAASCHGDSISIIYGHAIRYTWSQTLDRCRRLSSILVDHLNINIGDVVTAVASNIPAMYEMHFGVPMAGAVLNTMNIRLNAETMATLIMHSGSKVVFVDEQHLRVVQEALELVSSEQSTSVPLLVLIRDQFNVLDAESSDEFMEYEHLLRDGDPDFQTRWPHNEWQTISLNYTSGTTARPKGVVYHHRGAYLNSLVSAVMWGMKDFPVYLWTVPMFHCNGWCFTWAIAALAGTNVCLQNVSGKSIFDAIADHQVTHMGGAPVVLNMLMSVPPVEVRPLPGMVKILTGGAPPPPTMLSRIEDIGFDVTHAYGLTETYGPALYCSWKPQWGSLHLETRAAFKARQGIPNLSMIEAAVMDAKTMRKVPSDGKTIGEVMLRGNTIMKGYLKDEKATLEAFEGGWFHTGDLGVMHSDGYIQLKDRSKDIIISGGENISSIEIESVLYRHPEILEAAVVARPDEQWGETPCAFVHASTTFLSVENVIAFCRERLPHFMVPRSVVFGELPKTSTGKVQKHILRERAKGLGTLSKSKWSKL